MAGILDAIANLPGFGQTFQDVQQKFQDAGNAIAADQSSRVQGAVNAGGQALGDEYNLVTPYLQQLADSHVNPLFSALYNHAPRGFEASFSSMLGSVPNPMDVSGKLGSRYGGGSAYKNRVMDNIENLQQDIMTGNYTAHPAAAGILDTLMPYIVYHMIQSDPVSYGFLRDLYAPGTFPSAEPAST